MQAVLQQLPALLGVVIGAVATYFVSFAAERARWRRSQTVRWDERRLTAYTEYANAVKKVAAIAARLVDRHDSYRHRSAAGSVEPEQGAEDLADAEAERTMRWEQVLLLGSARTIIAARRWHESVYRLRRIALEIEPMSGWRDAVETVSSARREFYEAARSDLGIPIGESPEVYEWQLAKFIPSSGPDTSSEGSNSGP